MSGWTDEEIAFIKESFHEGLSANQIARMISVKFKAVRTRNSVISKLNRMGLLRGKPATSLAKRQGGRRRAKDIRGTGKGAPPKPASSPWRSEAMRKSPAPEFKVEPFVAAAEDVEIPLAQRKTIQTLEAKDCRWPIGDPQQADFHFCGKDKVQGLPYCESHARRAYQPIQVRRKPPATTVPLITATTKAPETVN